MSMASENRKRRKRPQQIIVEDDGEGNWLISYADMMTLLFGFFVVLSAFSTPDQKKLEELKKRTATAMGGKYVKPFEELSSEVKRMLSEIDLEKEIDIDETSEGITITSRGTLFFDSGSAVLKPLAQEVMKNLAHIISNQAKGYHIVVEGHTDDSPISTSMFPSNWELSSARAGTVVRLLENVGINSSDLRPVGLASVEPMFPNRDKNGLPIPRNQAENRRIVVRIKRKLPPRLGINKIDSKAKDDLNE